MGFSDSLKRITKQLVSTIGSSKSGFGKRAKSGRMNSSDWGSALGFGGKRNLTKSALSFITKPNSTTGRSLLSENYKYARGAAYGANLGHQVGQALFDGGDRTNAPAPINNDGQNKNTIAAKRQARQRSLDAAAKQRGLGLSGTIATTPLGLQGDGAIIRKKKLIGR